MVKSTPRWCNSCCTWIEFLNSPFFTFLPKRPSPVRFLFSPCFSKKGLFSIEILEIRPFLFYFLQKKEPFPLRSLMKVPFPIFFLKKGSLFCWHPCERFLFGSALQKKLFQWRSLRKVPFFLFLTKRSLTSWDPLERFFFRFFFLERDPFQ